MVPTNEKRPTGNRASFASGSKNKADDYRNDTTPTADSQTIPPADQCLAEMHSLLGDPLVNGATFLVAFNSFLAAILEETEGGEL